jgi:hypothetical protein
MKHLLENWQRFIKEETAAFHGYKMNPTQMRVNPCDVGPEDKEYGYIDNQWEAGEKGCPQFSNERGIGLDHPDIQQAVEFLDNVKPSDLIAYSRGGAVALAALLSATHKPNVTFVAPAWKRGWVNGIENPTYSNGVIVHGTDDELVPLWHSAELSLKTGMPLYVFPGKNHVSILKHKSKPETGRELTRKEKETLINETPT